MKNNRKNRKLNFIRIKNKLRLGKRKFYYKEKVSICLNIDSNYLNGLIKEAEKYLFDSYKLKLPVHQVTLHIMDDDFAQDLVTNVVSLSLK